jgi:hypothetical protein
MALTPSLSRAPTRPLGARRTETVLSTRRVVVNGGSPRGCLGLLPKSIPERSASEVKLVCLAIARNRDQKTVDITPANTERC